MSADLPWALEAVIAVGVGIWLIFPLALTGKSVLRRRPKLLH